MINKVKTEKEFDTVGFFREVKNKISLDIKNMSFEQLKEYLNKRQLKPIKK
jgi:hypothetical protein